MSQARGRCRALAAPWLWGANAFLSDLLFLPLQAAELGMVSAYYTYIFTNLVRRFNSPCHGMGVSFFRVSVCVGGEGAQDDAQEVRIGNTEAEASPRTGRVCWEHGSSRMAASHLDDCSSWGNRGL